MLEDADSGPHLEVGHRFSNVHVFNAEQVSAFALLAGDTNPLHHDAEAARQSRFGELIVSGTQTTALLLGLTASHFAKYGKVVGIGFKVEFLRAVPARARVQMGWEVTTVTKKSRGRLLLGLPGSLNDAQGRICVSAGGQVLVGAEI